MDNVRNAVLVLSIFLFLHISVVSAQSTGSAYGSGTYNSGFYGSGTTITTTPSPTGISLQERIMGVFTKDTTCNSLEPGSTPPTLFAATVIDSSSVELFFTPATKPFTHYSLEYGVKEDSLVYNIPSFGDQESRSVVVRNLNEDTTYVFRLRSFNECKPGLWTPILKARTTKNSDTYEFSPVVKKTDKDIDTNSTDSKTKNKQNGAGADKTLTITVVSSVEEPLVNAKIHILETGEQYTSDKNGTFTMKRPASGNYTFEVNSEEKKGKVVLSILPGQDTFTIQLKPKQVRWELYLLIFVVFVLLNLAIFRFVVGKNTSLPGFHSRAKR